MNFKAMLERVPSRWRWFLVVVFVVVVADQITKWQAVGHLTEAFVSMDGTELSFSEKLDSFLWTKHPIRTTPAAVIDNFWHHRYVENPGAAWGFLSRTASDWRRPFFLTISFVAMIFIIFVLRRTEPQQRLLRFGLSLVFGGALGNFLDRARLGYVIDFIDWHWFDKATWPTFNIADAGISVGVALMLLDALFDRSPKKAPKSAEQG